MSNEKEVAETEVEETPVFKIFVGNLSFKTTPDGLKTFFEECGEITNTSVISRGRRSLGYGFVDFATKEAADKALDTLNKKELDGREINLEVAKPRDSSKPRQRRNYGRRQGSYRGGRDYDRMPPRRFYDGGYRVSGYRDGGYRDGGYRDGGYRDGGYRDGGYRDGGYRDGYNRSYPREYRDDRRRDYRPRSRTRSRPRSEPRYDDGYQRNYRRRSNNNRRRRRRRRESEKDREPSTTTLFVTNLPFSLNDDGLRDVFKDFETVKHYVVTKKRNGRSKGYGFVEFKNEEDQQAALKSINGVTVEERKLVVKVAYASQTGENNKEEKN